MALTIHLNVNQHINYEENELPQLTENSRGLFWQSAQHVCISLCLTLQALLFVLSVKRFLLNERSIVQEKKKFSKFYVKLMSGDSSPLFCIFALGKEFHIEQSLTLEVFQVQNRIQPNLVEIPHLLHWKCAEIHVFSAFEPQFHAGT